MKRRRILLLLALVAVAAGLAFFWPRGPKEPAYQGKKISQWVEQAHMGESSERRENAKKALRAMGTNAVRWLMSEFTRPDPKWRVAFHRWLARQPWSGERIRDENDRVRSMAVGLYNLGPGAAPALPVLADYLSDSHRREAAAWAMSGAGELALPYFLKGLASTNKVVISAAIMGLGSAARDTEAAVAPLVQLLQDTNDSLRATAAYWLGYARPPPELVVSPLTAALSDPSPRVRHQAAFALGEIGYKARAAVPELLRLMGDAHSYVASKASNALFRIDPAALPARGP